MAFKLLSHRLPAGQVSHLNVVKVSEPFEDIFVVVQPNLGLTGRSRQRQMICKQLNRNKARDSVSLSKPHRRLSARFEITEETKNTTKTVKIRQSHTNKIEWTIENNQNARNRCNEQRPSVVPTDERFI
jgi:hypothetical protein